MKLMHNMMSNMSSEQLVAMSRASGHELSPEQVLNYFRASDSGAVQPAAP